jgi:hypothetical protein
MSATERDEALALRGYVIARTGCLPTDRSFQELSRNEPLLRFTAHWLQKREADVSEMVMRLLGTSWSREEVQRMADNKSAPPDEVFLPLAMAVNPELGEQLREMFRVGKGAFIGGGEYLPGQGEQVVGLGDLPVDQFKRLAQMATGAAEASSNPSVTLGNEREADPKIKQIRDQIAHSKRYR